MVYMRGILAPVNVGLQGVLIVSFQYIKGAYKRDGQRVFTNVCNDKGRQFLN